VKMDITDEEQPYQTSLSQDLDTSSYSSYSSSSYTSYTIKSVTVSQTSVIEDGEPVTISSFIDGRTANDLKNV